MNGIKYLPDTNIIIGLLKGRESAVKALEGISITDCKRRGQVLHLIILNDNDLCYFARPDPIAS